MIVFVSLISFFTGGLIFGLVGVWIGVTATLRSQDPTGDYQFRTFLTGRNRR